jgi:SAM-dependent methyltransferase
MAATASTPMRSAWLDIPLADYEGHMSEPGIGQAELLATQFAELLGKWSPTSAAVIGCAGGNGFDRLRVEVTGRVVGIDINPQYVQELASRYGARIPGLELYVRDIQEPLERIAPVALIYAALVFEYVAPQPVLQNLQSICRPGGVLATVLQLPSDHAAPISESPFTSLKGLASAMHLVSPAALAADANEAGFELLSSRLLRLSSGKEFAVQVYQLEPVLWRSP